MKSYVVRFIVRSGNFGGITIEGKRWLWNHQFSRMSPIYNYILVSLMSLCVRTSVCSSTSLQLHCGNISHSRIADSICEVLVSLYVWPKRNNKIMFDYPQVNFSLLSFVTLSIWLKPSSGERWKFSDLNNVKLP